MLAILEPIFNFIQFMTLYIINGFDHSIPKLSLKHFSMSKLKELFSYGLKSSTMLIASRLQNQSIPFIIGNVIGVGNIVYFVMPNRLSEYAKGLSQTLGFPLVPYFGEAIGRSNQDEVKASWLKTSLALQAVSMAMPPVLVFYGGPFLEQWIGRDYAIAGKAILYGLAAGLFVCCIDSKCL